MGFTLEFREDCHPRHSFLQWAGIAYASLALVLGLKKAFGHANPYHRYAFPKSWWYNLTKGADVALIYYSYWAHLPSACPKVLVLLDLWSNYMWGGSGRETQEIAACDHTFVISMSEITQLKARGIRRLSWSPPLVWPGEYPPAEGCALIGSANRFNLEGLRWLERAGSLIRGCPIRVYGALSGKVKNHVLEQRGRYEETDQPYRENGLVLLATVQGMGVQIKTIEALTSGRAVIARKGAVRGLPPGEGAWVEVETPEEALEWICRLSENEAERRQWAAKTRAYARRHLDADTFLKDIKTVLLKVGQGEGEAGSSVAVSSRKDDA
jgi:hypothetical protein